MDIYGRVLPSGLLYDVYHRLMEPGDVPIAVMPQGRGPFGYDAVNQVAIPLPLTLEEVKSAAYAAVDARTQQLQAAGFSYTPGGSTRAYSFSLGPAEQTVWLGTFVSSSLLTYPLQIGTVDNQLASLQGQEDVQAFYAAAVTTLHTILGSGAQLKAAIAAAIDQVGVAAVVDSR